MSTGASKRLRVRTVDAIIQTLTEKHSFGTAETVLLTGCSAGGLATYLHTDYVASQLPTSVTKYGASAISGFFLMHKTVEVRAPAILATT